MYHETLIEGFCRVTDIYIYIWKYVDCGNELPAPGVY